MMAEITTKRALSNPSPIANVICSCSNWTDTGSMLTSLWESIYAGYSHDIDRQPAFLNFSWYIVGPKLEINSSACSNISLISCHILFTQCIANGSGFGSDIIIASASSLYASATKLATAIFAPLFKMVVISICFRCENTFRQPHDQARPLYGNSVQSFFPAT